MLFPNKSSSKSSGGRKNKSLSEFPISFPRLALIRRFPDLLSFEPVDDTLLLDVIRLEGATFAVVDSDDDDVLLPEEDNRFNELCLLSLVSTCDERLIGCFCCGGPSP